MIHEFPDTLERFRCVGGRCADTCCAGWEVDIDDETAQWYREIPGTFGEKLRASLRQSEEDGCQYFPLTETGRCPFLDENNLCEIFSHLGEAALSRVCTEYPRYYVQVGDYEQIDMSLSCMEYGRIFFAAGEEKLMRAEDDLTEEALEEADEERLLAILDFRDWAVARMQSGEGCWDVRLREIEAEALRTFYGAQAGEKSGGAASASAGRDAEDSAVSASAGWDIAGTQNPDWLYGNESDAALFRRISSLELIDHRWLEIARRTEAYYRSAAAANPSGQKESMRAAAAEQEKQTERWFTRLSVYFLFRYTIDIWYDGEAAGVFRLVNRSLRYLFWMTEAALAARGGLDEKDIVNIAHLYSKQVEHSEENIAIMKDVTCAS